MPLPAIDWASLTDAELETLSIQGVTEQRLRRLPQQAAAISEEYLVAVGRTPGAAWVQPAGGHDAYPKGWKVTHNGKTWASKIAANVWAPGQDPNASLWQDLTTAPTPSVWAAGVAVVVGQSVTYNGASYRALQAHTTQAGWTPPVVPALWAPVITTTTTTAPRK